MSLPNVDTQARQQELRGRIDQLQKDIERERREYHRERRVLKYRQQKAELERELAQLMHGETPLRGFAEEQRTKVGRFESLWHDIKARLRK